MDISLFLLYFTFFFLWIYIIELSIQDDAGGFHVIQMILSFPLIVVSGMVIAPYNIGFGIAMPSCILFTSVYVMASAIRKKKNTKK